MSNFTRYDAQLTIQYHLQASTLLGADYWVVTEPFVYHIDHVGSHQYVTVPTGFLTDGASVPKPLWGMLPPWGDYGQAAVLHDYLCEYGYITNGFEKIAITRKQSDHLFLQAMEVLNVNRFKRNVLAKGVNLHRVLAKPPSPNENPMKTYISDIIMENRRKTGSFLLLHHQIEHIKQRYGLT